MKEKVLHVMGRDKFIPPFIDLLEGQECFDGQTFYIFGDERKFPVRRRENTLFANDYPGELTAWIDLVKKLNASRKIVIHSLFRNEIILLLFLQPWLLKRCYWMIWGSDLYYHQLAERNWKWRISEFFRRPVIRRMGHLVTYVEGDVELARKWYGATGQYHECILYTSNIYHEHKLPFRPHRTINIQIGNSADPSNNHLEILERLLPYRGQDIVIYAPLSYGAEGSQDYVRSVIKAGTEMFGDKFRPMTEFLSFEQYLDFLSRIDIAIFNHKRQQAMGNTITLLGLGKKVYLRDDVTHYDMLKSIGITTFNIADLELSRISRECARQNVRIIKEYFSEKKLRVQLQELLA